MSMGVKITGLKGVLDFWINPEKVAFVLVDNDCVVVGVAGVPKGWISKPYDTEDEALVEMDRVSGLLGWSGCQ